MIKCNICGSTVIKILDLDSGHSVTSLGRVIETSAAIYVCTFCSHSQTETCIELSKYYASDYKTLSSYADEDDLYEIRGGSIIYRNEHMSAVLASKLPNIKGDILDFGCGKSLLMKHYIEQTNKSNIYLYDVSKDYIKFWDRFISSSQYACFDIPAQWESKFQLVTSSFSMEHVRNPIAELRAIKRVLSSDGMLYLVIPNMYSSNSADMLVVDHVQHYSEPSIKQMLYSGGFDLIEVDHKSHTQASIYIAKQIMTPRIVHKPDQAMIDLRVDECKKISRFWLSVSQRVRQFEGKLLDRGLNKYLIIGAGIVGTYLFLQLRYPGNVIGFIDSNKYKQQKGWNGIPVFEPSSAPADAFTGIIAGFNIEQVDQLLPKMIPHGVLEENIWNVKIDVD